MRKTCFRGRAALFDLRMVANTERIHGDFKLKVLHTRTLRKVYLFALERGAERALVKVLYEMKDLQYAKKYPTLLTQKCKESF